MTLKRIAQGIGTFAGFTGFILVGALITSPGLRADDDHKSSGNDERIDVGLQIAPVHLTYAKHDRELVGLGSYFVNAVSGCNGCHSAGPQTEYALGHNPYFGQPKLINTATYLAGGRDFGTVAPPPSPHIVSRNLTPDKSGLPEGGATFGDSFRPSGTASTTTDSIQTAVRRSRRTAFLTAPAYRRSMASSFKSCRGLSTRSGPTAICWRSMTT